MKLLTMKCIHDPDLYPEEGGGWLGEEHWVVKLETEDEHLYYKNFVEHSCPRETGEEHKAYSDGKNYGFWSGYMSSKLDDYYTDNDIYSYLEPNESEPAIGEIYEDADGLGWKRIK